MSIFTAIGRVLRFAADEVMDVVTDTITRRAGDDLVDIPDAIDDDFQELGALENLGQEQRPEGFFDEVRRIAAEPTQFEQEPQMTINITPEQQAGIDAIREREAAAAINDLPDDEYFDPARDFDAEIARIDATRARNADILRNTVDVDQFLSDPTNEAEARAQAALELIRAGRLDEVLANNNLVNALSDGDGEAYIARHSTRRYDADVDDDIVDADFEDIDIANAEEEATNASIRAAIDEADAQSINIALRDNPIFQDPQVRQSVEQLRVGGGTNSEIREYLSAVKREYEEARRPVTRSIDATNTEQLRELYAKYKLPIPKTDAEALAAELIMEADRGILGDIGVSARRNIDLNYLKAHAPDDVYKKHGPTILEAKLAQQASVIPPLRTDNSRSGLPFYSAAARAAENLKVPSGSYEKLKKLALKQGGVKAKEFEWSGADEAFEGRTDVTPAELAEYLKQNSNLIREEQKMATGVMRDASSGGYDDGIDGFLDSPNGQDYIENYLEGLEENFKENFTYSTNMQDIGSYVADDDFVALDKFAKKIDGVSSGRELAEKYPDGWLATDEYYFETKVFGSEEAAANWEWRDNIDSYEQQAREGAENNLNEMRVYDPEDFNMTVFGSNDPTADPADLEYANYFPSGGTDMTETRYVFDDPTGDLPEGYFKAGHFDDDENVVAHARAGEFPVETGGTAYHLGEAQSDVQQAARKAAGPTRTREQELFKDNYDSVKDLFRQYVVGAENDLSHKVFGYGIGRSNTRFRDNPEALTEYKTIVADFLNDQSGHSPSFSGKFRPENITDDHSFFDISKGNTTDLNVRLNEFAKYIQENKDRLPEPYTAWADIHTGLSMPNIQKQSDELEKLEASGINVENTTVGAPMLESTDAWLDMVLRSQLSDAIASGADYLTLPNPQMVKDYTGGDFEGHRQFYGNIAPKNLMNVVKPADPTADFVPIKIKTGKQPEDVLGLPLTQDLITGLRKMGLPKYVVPFGGVGYGALGAMAEDEETAAGGGL